MRHHLFLEIVSALLAMVFIYAAISKLIDFNNFSLQLNQSPFIYPFAGWVVWIIPAGETFTVFLLLIKKLRLYGLFASLFIMSLFTAYLIAMLNFSDYLPCSCGGLLEMLSWKAHIVFNSFLLLLSSAGIGIYTQSIQKIYQHSRL